MASESTDNFIPATQSELSRFVSENAAEHKHPLYPVGGRTSLNYGYPTGANGTTVSTSELTKTIDYPARDMTITVQAGIRIDNLARMLKSENQQLPVDVAQSHRATLGGVVATNTSGPRRFAHGTMRDYVIGMSAVDAQGRLFSAGGRVVKNVAGYDLCKLMVGSMGTLAILTQLTLKLRPLAETSALLWTTYKSFTQIDVTLERLLTSAARPVAIEVLDPKAAQQIQSEARYDLPTNGPVLCLGIEGTEREIDWQVECLQRECADAQSVQSTVVKSDIAEPLWKALTEFQVNVDEPLTFQANLLPSRTMEFVECTTRLGVAVQAHAGNGIVIGHLSDDIATINKATEIVTSLRQLARQNHGNLVIFHCNAAWKNQLPVFGYPEPSWPLMRKLKRELDPDNILNPTRFIDGAMRRTGDETP